MLTQPQQLRLSLPRRRRRQQIRRKDSRLHRTIWVMLLLPLMGLGASVNTAKLQSGAWGR